MKRFGYPVLIHAFVGFQQAVRCLNDRCLSVINFERFVDLVNEPIQTMGGSGLFACERRFQRHSNRFYFAEEKWLCNGSKRVIHIKPLANRFPLGEILGLATAAAMDEGATEYNRGK